MTTVEPRPLTATPPPAPATPPATATVPSPVRTGLLVERWPVYLGALVAAVVVPMLLGGIGLLNDTRALALGTGLVFAVAGLSVNLLTGYTGQLSLGHFALVGVGSFTAAKVTGVQDLRLPFGAGLVAAIVVGAAMGALIGLPALRIRGLYLAVVTVGFQYAMEQSLFASNWLARGSAGAELPRPYAGDFAFTSNVTYVALIAPLLVVLWVIDTHVTQTRLGRAFRAVKADEDVAASFGISVERTKLLAFALSGAFAGVAGSMYAHLTQFIRSDSFTFDQSLLLVAIVVIGGLGSRAGVVVAGIFFGISPILLDTLFGGAGDDWELIVGAVLLLFTVASNPEGFAGAIRHTREQRGEAEAKARAASGESDDDLDALPQLPSLPAPTGLPERRQAAGPVLTATGVTVDFGGLRAVDDATIEVPRNRIVGLVGPNGAGKTTLFNAVSGAVAATAGRVVFGGADISALPADGRARLGMARTFQSLGLATDQTVTENLLLAQHLVADYDLGRALLGIGATQTVERELRERAAATLDALGFTRFADTPVRNLSGGQQRIVEIAANLLTAPELVMLDEPSAGMAPAAVENLAVRLQEMRDDLGRTVLLIEHNIPLVLDVCDEVYVMAAGRIIAHGAPDVVVADPQVIEAYLGEDVS